MARRVSYLFLAGLAGLTVGAVPPPRSDSIGSAPRVWLSSLEVSDSRRIDFFADGYQPGEPVSVLVWQVGHELIGLGPVRANGRGDLGAALISEGQAAPGDYELALRGQWSGREARARFTIGGFAPLPMESVRNEDHGAGFSSRPDQWHLEAGSESCDTCRVMHGL